MVFVCAVPYLLIRYMRNRSGFLKYVKRLAYTRFFEYLAYNEGMVAWLKSFRSYEAIAFVTGFSLMAYELVASRILAPTIGSSIYVWTSVIGVIIAALSLGFAAGGYLADRRVQETDIAWLLLASALTVALTLSASPAVLQLAVRLFADVRLQGVFASAFLFAPTSFLLGVISPYLARLKNVSVRTTGTTIASLSALNALGGIVGTFCTGFIFFAYLGSRETMLVVAIVLMLSSWLIQARQHTARRLILCAWTLVLILSTGFVAAQANTVATIDTPSATYRITHYTQAGKPVRGLATGPLGMQSAVYQNGSTDLVFAYTRAIADLAGRAPQKQNILILGGGAFTLPQYLAQVHPDARIDVVEIDPRLVDISRRHFGYQDPPNVRVISQDARAFLNANTKKYDIIVVDVYSELLIPFSLSTTQYTRALKNASPHDGVILANIIGSGREGCSELLGALHHSYASQFPYHRAYPLEDSGLHALQNIIVAYSQSGPSWLPDAPVSLDVFRGPTLSDNFAPVERLKQNCA